MGNGECKVQGSKGGAERNAECGVRNAECGVRSAECGTRNAECGSNRSKVQGSNGSAERDAECGGGSRLGARAPGEGAPTPWRRDKGVCVGRTATDCNGLQRTVTDSNG